MELKLVTPKQKEMEILGGGQYALVRYQCTLPDGVSDVMRRSLAALRPDFSPESEWWRNHSGQIQKLEVEHQELLRAYARLGHWQDVTLGLGLISETVHGIIVALAIPTNIVDLAPWGGSALAFGGALAAVLRYLKKERAATMGTLGEVQDSAAKFQSMAQQMVMIPQMADLPDNKFKMVAKIYCAKQESNPGRTG